MRLRGYYDVCYCGKILDLKQEWIIMKVHAVYGRIIFDKNLSYNSIMNEYSKFLFG